MEFLKKYINYIILAACVLIAVSLFLPLVTISMDVLGSSYSESVNFIEGDGKIILGLVIGVGILILTKKSIPALVLAAASAYITFSDIRNVSEEFVKNQDLLFEIEMSYGVGFYLLIAGLVIVLGGLLLKIFVFDKNKNSDETEFAPASIGSVLGGMIPSKETTSNVDNTISNNPQTIVENPLENKICSCCGSNMPHNMNFCTNCGNKLNK